MVNYLCPCFIIYNHINKKPGFIRFRDKKIPVNKEISAAEKSLDPPPIPTQTKNKSSPYLNGIS